MVDRAMRVAADHRGTDVILDDLVILPIFRLRHRRGTVRSHDSNRSKTQGARLRSTAPSVSEGAMPNASPVASYCRRAIASIRKKPVTWNHSLSGHPRVR